MNDAQGVVAFDAIAFDSPGAHELSIVQVAGSDGGVVYDDAVFGLAVTVFGDLKGHLVAEYAYRPSVPVFVNVAADSASAGGSEGDDADGRGESLRVVSPLPRTGDDAAGAFLWLGAAAFAAAAALAAAVRRARRGRTR